MSRLLPLITFLSLAACSDTEPVASVASLLAEGSTPPVYANYTDLAPLFNQQDDTTYLVNFWATWCKPCLEELPLLQQVADERSADERLRIVLVSLDTEDRAIQRIPAYLSAQDITLPVVVLTDTSKEWMRGLDDKWDGSLPTTFVYRKALRYIYRRPFRTVPDVRSAVAPLVGQ